VTAANHEGVPAAQALEADLDRIGAAISAVTPIVRRIAADDFAVETKERGDPVTEADRLVNERLHEILPRDGEGWLSEETVDDLRRLDKRRVWVVDPLDGTREFVQRIPEYCVSIGLVENGVPVAGGIANPVTGEVMIGGLGLGLRLNGEVASAGDRDTLDGALVLASRSEVKRGEWERFQGAPFRIQAMGSVAYKLALVAAGKADATWTLVPKHEWDVAAGVALVRAAGGEVFSPTGTLRRFNAAKPKLPGLIASGASLAGPIRRLLSVPG
jgi:myo-inositol-1(or 4)-monophosphatase